MKRIGEFEALRGLLALWVVVGHVLKACGYTPIDFGALHFLAEPGLAVDVFIVLSGFVIFNLLDQQGQPYWIFIVQRFFRLYPLYTAALAGSIAIAWLKLSWLDALPWHGPFDVGLRAIARSSVDHLLEHTTVHLTMLHGLVPDSILPFSEYALLGQAWSISVEWQFYIVAPFIFFLLRRSPIGLTTIVFLIAILRSRYWLGEGFAINQAGYFTVGIVSYFAYRRLHDRPISHDVVLLGVAVSASLIYFFAIQSFSMILWVIFFAAAVAGTNPLSKICNWQPLRWCGQVSYSIYLVHFIVLVLSSATLLSLAPGLNQAQHTCALIALTIVGTLAASSITWRFIEKPGIQFGRHLTDRRPVMAA